MYFLNDEHPEYEYSLYTRVEDATPYVNIINAKSVNDLARFIAQLEKKHSYGKKRLYYIDNDFYKNPYPLMASTTYYKFMRRKVNDWEEFKTTANDKDIIYIEKYFKKT